jgi:hypothetical protein
VEAVRGARDGTKPEDAEGVGPGAELTVVDEHEHAGERRAQRVQHHAGHARFLRQRDARSEQHGCHDDRAGSAHRVLLFAPASYTGRAASVAPSCSTVVPEPRTPDGRRYMRNRYWNLAKIARLVRRRPCV